MGATNRRAVDNSGDAIRLRQIFDIVLRRFGTSRTDMESARRDRPAVLARQMYCLLARELTDKSGTQIAALIGNRHHTTVLYAARASRERAASDPEYAEHYAYCMRKLGRLL